MSRAGAWRDHLIAGGTTAWSEFVDDSLAPSGSLGSTPAERSTASTPAERSAPAGAQHLEVLRRINAHKPASPAVVEAVLGARLTGRGLPELGLPAETSQRFGPTALDPSLIADVELLRVCVAVLAHHASQAAPTPPRQAVPRLLGDPSLVAASTGRVPLRRCYVLAASLDLVLASAWQDRCLRPLAPSWPRWLQSWEQRGHLPPRADLAAMAERSSSTRWPIMGAGPTVVVWPGAAANGLSVGPHPRLGAGAAELLRQISATLAVLVTPESHAGQALTVAGWLRGRDDADLRIPQQLRDWVWGQAADQRTRLARYAAYGVAPSQSSSLRSGEGQRPSAAAALSVATRVLADGLPD